MLTSELQGLPNGSSDLRRLDGGDHSAQNPIPIMKTVLTRWANRGRSVLAASIVTSWLLSALTVAAASSTSYTATGRVTSVPIPFTWHTNGLGQVLLRGNVHLTRVESSDARLTGQRLILMNGAVQTNGSVLLFGTGYQQVGQWDSTGIHFTGTGGLWEITYQGMMEADHSIQLHSIGAGLDGSIEGSRLEEDAAGSACGDLLDPDCSYLYTGTIKPPPVDTNEIVDNFDDNRFTGRKEGSCTVVETNQQFSVSGLFGVPTRSMYDSYCMAGYARTWVIPDGMTLEWRVDVVSLSDNATNTAILALGNDHGPGYILHAGRDFVFLLKWASSGSYCVLFGDRASLENTNLVLALALTRVQRNLAITARVFDKAHPDTARYARTVVDTPLCDATLKASQFQDLTGIRVLDLAGDVAELPPTTNAVWLGVFQNTDGHQPVPQAVFDNLEVWTSETPPLNIASAVQLSWPASTTVNHDVETAPTVQGPWLPAQESAVPGIRQVTVPTREPKKFFRLRQVP